MPIELKMLCEDIQSLQLSRPVGHVIGVVGGTIQVSGLDNDAQIGDHLVIKRAAGKLLSGEVLQIDNGTICMLPEAAPDGVAMGDSAILHKTPSFRPGDHWIGRVVDPYGNPLDGKALMRSRKARDLMASPPPAVKRNPLGERIDTGLSVLNTMLPIVEGQRIGLFAGSGVGKSRLLAQLARSMKADVVVITLIGERGREVNDFVDQVLGPRRYEACSCYSGDSDQSALTRRRCAWAGMAIAEHFRDAGKNVLFLADSVTRFAEAHREIAVAGGEAPALRGFPPSVSPMITSLCERAGPGMVGQGHITSVFSVLVAGSDMDEPIADVLRGVLDGHIVLNRDIAERGRFPAIDVSKSVSRSLPEAASESENEAILDTKKLLGAYEQSEVMIKAGLYSEGSDPVLDRAIALWPDLDSFFSTEELDCVRHSFDRLRLILRRASGNPNTQLR